MGEIIFLHLGQAGVQIGGKLWDQFQFEQTLNPNNANSPCKTLFQEQNSTWTSRSIFADLDPDSINHLFSSANSKHINPSNLISGKEDSSNNNIRGHYTTGRSILDPIKERMRIESEACDNLQGFVITHSIGGGTGSGLNPWVLNEAEYYFAKKPTINFTVFPSPFISPVIVEPYNAILGLEDMYRSSSACFILDNQRLFDICVEKLRIKRPEYRDINCLIAYSMSAVLGTCVNGGSINQNLNEIVTNLNSTKFQNFMSAAVSPILNKDQAYRDDFSVSQVTEQAFDSSFDLVKLEPSKYLGCTLAYKGDIVPKDIGLAISTVKSKNLQELSEIELSAGYDETPLVNNPTGIIGGISKSACVLKNSPGVKPIFEEILQKFNKMYSKRAFVHWYSGEGLSEGYFESAREELSQFINNLSQYS